MSKEAKKILERVASWPEEDQEELAAAAAEIEARRTGIHRLSDDECAAVRKAMAAAQNGAFAPESEMDEFYRLHRKA
jgi:hypothetical protein